jgi:hypothetical protein
MVSAKMSWVRKEIGRGFKAAKTKSERKNVMKNAWAAAKKKFD